MRIITNLITELKQNEIFVFGSNESGWHGGGAAKTAMKWGAKDGQASGLQGKTYAIPTVNYQIDCRLTVEEVKKYVDEFIAFAENNKNLKFLVTEIGCGIAGFFHKEIAPLFIKCVDMENVWLPLKFIEFYNIKN